MAGRTGTALQWLADTFRGLTWRRFAVFCIVVELVTLQQVLALAALVPGRFKHMPTGMEGLAKAFLLSFFAYLPVLLAVVAVGNRAHGDDRSRAVRLGVATLLAAAVGTALVWASLPNLYPNGFFRLRWDALPDDWWRTPIGLYLGYLGYSAAAVAVYYYLQREARIAARLHAEELQREQSERESAEARLQVMQAQIEPHFLFNTLASVRRLYRTDIGAGRGMMRHLTSYLEASLPSMRESRSTLGREIALATAYLSVQKIRMEARLDFRIDVPERLRAATVPPMMLATLVENAVIHGLGPLPAGGCIRISAEECEGKLMVRVADDGQGLKDSWGAGVGLSNIRTRLQSAFGDAGRLHLASGDERGVTATLELPIASESVPA